MDVINESLRKVCSHTTNIKYDYGGLCEGTKDGENAFFKLLNSISAKL